MHNVTGSDVLSKLKTSENGLTGEEAAKRLVEYGKNALAEEKKRSIFLRILDQIKDPMVIVLIAAAVISGVLDEIPDMIIILLVVILNAVIGLIQESKAEKAVEALKKMSASYAKVIRSGSVLMVSAEEIVPGDIVMLDAGDLVPADLRLLTSSSLKIEEASLTGESVPSDKFADEVIPEDAPLGDRKNLAYFGTGVTYGRGMGVVVSTGMDTEMGKIAAMISSQGEQQTPLQRKLAELSKVLTIGVMLVCVVVFGVIVLKSGSFNFDTVLKAFLISVSLAVAAIPEGLPTVVTIVMAIGVTVMAKRRAIIKKLPAVETLGCAEVICSDKTGTLTQNKMDIREIYTEQTQYAAADFLKANCDLMLNILCLCNDSDITENGEIGDPTEICLKKYAYKKYSRDSFARHQRISDLPFDSERKMMSTVNSIDGKEYVFTKGAPDEVLKICTSISINGEVRKITDADKNAIMNANGAMARKALRVLGAAYKQNDGGELEKELIFVGLAGMIDPPRPEAFEAIERCKQAGIITVMITGDHKDTAIAIAKELRIIDDESQAVSGNIIDSMDDKQLEVEIQNIRVFARVSPQHKVRIVQAWKRLGKIVAMTGDGVNDAPALKIADIGIGMGITGTDVSKGVSDMLLSDDNFATIVNAVEEGRKIYTNIRKAVQFLLSCNISEVLALFVATLLLPAGVQFLGAVHILWINLVTDALPALGLGMNKGEDGVMTQKPRNANASIFSGGVGINILYQGALISVLVLISYYTGYGDKPEAATTMAFITLSMVQLFHSFNVKAGSHSVFSRETFDNPMLLAGFAVPILLTCLIMFTPLISVFELVPLTGIEWLVCIGLAAIIIPVDEIIRFIRKSYRKRKQA